MNHTFAPNNLCARATGSRLTAIDVENGQLTRSDKRQRIEIVPVKIVVVRGKIKFMSGIPCCLTLSVSVSLIGKSSESFAFWCYSLS
jgi:hypothetical protein